MEKYYLLTFDQDYADEHNVPALACMTEVEYNTWLETPSGTPNEKYAEQLLKQQESEEKSKAFWKILEDKGYVLNGSVNTSMIPKDDLETLQLEKKYREYSSSHSRWGSPKKVQSRMRAYLGNSGERFDESYSHLYLMKEFVEEGTVLVFEVSREFYDTFHLAKLDSLSLCNVFTINE